MVFYIAKKKLKIFFLINTTKYSFLGREILKLCLGLLLLGLMCIYMPSTTSARTYGLNYSHSSAQAALTQTPHPRGNRKSREPVGVGDASHHAARIVNSAVVSASVDLRRIWELTRIWE